MTWEASSVRDPLNWWTVWAKHVPHLRAVALTVKKLPVRFAADEQELRNLAIFVALGYIPHAPSCTLN